MSPFCQTVSAAFEAGLCCSEAMVKAVAEHTGREAEPALAMAAGLCGGLGERQGSCGALTGAVIALGLVDESERGRSARELGAELERRFRARHGGNLCHEVLATKGLLQGKRRFCRGVTEAVAADLEQLLPCLEHSN